MTLIHLARIIRNGAIDGMLIAGLMGVAMFATVLLWICEDKGEKGHV